MQLLHPEAGFRCDIPLIKTHSGLRHNLSYLPYQFSWPRNLEYVIITWENHSRAALSMFSRNLAKSPPPCSEVDLKLCLSSENEKDHLSLVKPLHDVTIPQEMRLCLQAPCVFQQDSQHRAFGNFLLDLV